MKAQDYLTHFAQVHNRLSRINPIRNTIYTSFENLDPSNLKVIAMKKGNNNVPRKYIEFAHFDSVSYLGINKSEKGKVYHDIYATRDGKHYILTAV